MALIERTIYPRFNKKISQYELLSSYTPSDEEIKFAYTQVRGLENVCIFLITLKTFKTLNYFPNHETIPYKIINHLKNILATDDLIINFKERTLKRHKQTIREQLNVLSNTQTMKDLIFKTVENFEPLMEHPEDVFNAVIETLIKNNYELPGFNTLSRLINNKKMEINTNIFSKVSSRGSDRVAAVYCKVTGIN